MDLMYTVYMHTAPNGKKYIGITCLGIAKRWGSGGIGYKKCPYFWNAIKNHGWDNIVHEVLSEGLTEAEAKQSEKELICFHKTRDSFYGYNLTDGGDGTCGWIPSAKNRANMSAARMGWSPSAETRAKMSVLKKNRLVTDETRAKLSAFGKTRVPSIETRAKLSAAQRGKIASAEARANMRVAQKGKVVSAEARAKMSASWMGIPKTAEAKQKMRDAHILLVKDVERLTMDGEVIGHYVSCGDAAEKTGINKSGICHACSGRHKTAGGFMWRYVTKEVK